MAPVSRAALVTLDGMAADLAGPITVGPQPAALLLRLPAGARLVAGQLTLEPLTGTDTLEWHRDGPASALRLVADSENLDHLAWFILDLGVERHLESLQVRCEGVARGRIRYAAGTAWVPLAPTDHVESLSRVRLGGIITSRLMIEFMQSDNRPAQGTLSWASITASAAPCDLSVAVTGGPTMATRSGLLRTGEPLVIASLAETVNTVLGTPPRGGDVRLDLTARIAGKVKIGGFSARCEVWHHRAEDRLDFPLPGQKALTIPVGTAKSLSRVEVALAPRLVAERMLTTPDADGSGDQARRAASCAPGCAAAQGFKALDAAEALTEVQVALDPRHRLVVGRVAVHADAAGRPAPKALASQSFTLSGDAAGVVWRPTPPLRLAAPWWLVIAVDRGEALWWMQPGRPAPATVPAWCGANGQWLPRDVGPFWTPARLMVAGGKPAGLAVAVRRGDRIATLDGVGERVWRLADEGLAVVNGTASNEVDVLVTTDGRGSVGVAQLDVRAVDRED